MTIEMRVLKNPCINKGICQGPETDPECTSVNRTKGKNIVVLQKQRFQFRSDKFYNHKYCGIRINISDLVLISYAYAQVMQLPSSDKETKYQLCGIQL